MSHKMRERKKMRTDTLRFPINFFLVSRNREKFNKNKTNSIINILMARLFLFWIRYKFYVFLLTKDKLASKDVD